jgi:hypothetical protein
MNDDVLALQHLTDDVVRAKRNWGYAPADSEEQRRQVAAALDYALDDDERFVIDHYYRFDRERLALTRIGALRGWKPSRASAVRQRALGKLYDAAFVPSLPPVGSWVLPRSDQPDDPLPGTPARVLRHEGRYRYVAAVALPYTDREGRAWYPLSRRSDDQQRELEFALTDADPLLPEQALTLARALRYRPHRVEALAALVPYLTDPTQQHAVLREAAADARHIRAPGRRAKTMAYIIRAEPPSDDLADIIAQIPLDVARIADVWDRNTIVHVLEPYLDADGRAQLTTALQAPAFQERIADELNSAYEMWRRQQPPGMGSLFDHSPERLSADVIAGFVLRHDDPPARQIALVFDHETSPYFFRPDVQRWVSLALITLPEPPEPEALGAVEDLGMIGTTAFALDTQQQVVLRLFNWGPAVWQYFADATFWPRTANARALALATQFAQDCGKFASDEQIAVWVTAGLAAQSS